MCILREDNFSRQGVIDYNVLCFREAISQVFELRSQALSKIMETSLDGIDDEGDEEVDEPDFGKAASPAEPVVVDASASRSTENGNAGRTRPVAELNDSATVLA